MSVSEVRISTIHEGKRHEFVRLFDEVLLPAQREFRLDIIGQFISLDDQTFVWLRRFDSRQARQRKREEFDSSELWSNRLGLRANSPIKDSSNVIAVEPTPSSAIQ
jgi:hypothetical protein